MSVIDHTHHKIIKIESSWFYLELRFSGNKALHSKACKWISMQLRNSSFQYCKTSKHTSNGGMPCLLSHQVAMSWSNSFHFFGRSIWKAFCISGKGSIWRYSMPSRLQNARAHIFPFLRGKMDAAKQRKIPFDQDCSGLLQPGIKPDPA